MSDLADILADAQAFDAELRSRFVTAAKDAAEAGRTKAMASRRWKDRTGATATSIKATGGATAEGGEGTLDADGENAVRLMEGTAPHTIAPRNPGGRLRFEVGGAVRFARQVNHPGTAPDGYLDAAGDAMETELDAAVDGILGALLG